MAGRAHELAFIDEFGETFSNVSRAASESKPSPQICSLKEPIPRNASEMLVINGKRSFFAAALPLRAALESNEFRIRPARLLLLPIFRGSEIPDTHLQVKPKQPGFQQRDDVVRIGNRTGETRMPAGILNHLIIRQGGMSQFSMFLAWP